VASQDEEPHCGTDGARSKARSDGLDGHATEQVGSDQSETGEGECRIARGECAVDGGDERARQLCDDRYRQ